jgi:hypothetical protein
MTPPFYGALECHPLDRPLLQIDHGHRRASVKRRSIRDLELHLKTSQVPLQSCDLPGLSRDKARGGGLELLLGPSLSLPGSDELAARRRFSMDGPDALGEVCASQSLPVCDHFVITKSVGEPVPDLAWDT